MSGWAILLPLVGAVLGGIIGAWANSWYRNREAQRARKEEREGLLILLSIEVARNDRLFETILKQRASQPDIDVRAGVAADLQSAVWDESKVRLAQLQLSGTDLELVALYYERLDILRRIWTVPSDDLSERDTISVLNRRENGHTVIRATQRYISDPLFAPLHLDEDP